MNVCESPKKNIFRMDQKCVDPFVKSRRKEWQHEVYKSNNSADQRKLSYIGDRFIPKRFKSDNIERNLKYIDTRCEKDILKSDLTLTSNYWRQNSFISTINNTFNIQERRLLEFSNYSGHSPRPTECRRRLHTDRDWPCSPRSMPCAIQDATHDQPEIDRAPDYNLMDWSALDHIAVSFGKDVIIWRNKDDTTLVFNVKNPRSLKYSPSGKHLAIGCIECQLPVLELWEVQSGKDFLVADGKYFAKHLEAITCIEWNIESGEILCGTACGPILVLSMPKLKIVTQIRKHKSEVTIMRFSPNVRYLATADVEGSIYIFDGITYQVIMRVGTKVRYGVMLDWHPWTGVHLAISENTPASIFIFHVPRREIVAYYQRMDKKIIINSINFCKVTGELLVSISRRGGGCIVSEILVLSSLNRVVDILGSQDRGSVFMVWGPDGTKLAAAGLDGSFSIWNFYPKHKVNAFVCSQYHRQRAEDCSQLSLFTPLR